MPRDRSIRRMLFAVETLRTRARLRTVQVRSGNISTALDRSFGACNMGFDPLEVFRAVFHAALEDANVTIMDLDGTQTDVNTECFNSERHPSYAAFAGRFSGVKNAKVAQHRVYSTIPLTFIV